jgi:hypothetical protein
LFLSPAPGATAQENGASVFLRRFFHSYLSARRPSIGAVEVPAQLGFSLPTWIFPPQVGFRAHILLLGASYIPSTMATETVNNFKSPPGKKRKTKDLPECLLYLNDRNVRTKVQARLETDSKEIVGEVMVAYAMLLEDESAFDLNSLTLDQIRKLCKNVGV